MAGIDNTNAPATADRLLENSEDMSTCTVCTSEIALSQLIGLRCGSLYCKDCLTKVFENAMKDETAYPPSCCGGEEIPIKLATKHLPKSLITRFKARKLELTTRNKTYCYQPICSAFIAPHSIHNGQAICQTCRSVTCNKCRKRFHFGPCVQTEDEAAFFELIRSTRWKRCPACRRMVEKNDGCNHIV